MFREHAAKMEVWVRYMSGPEDTAEVKGRTYRSDRVIGVKLQ